MASPAVPTPPRPRGGSDPEPPPLDLLRPLRSAGSLENPYPVYAVLRTVRPVLEVPVPGAGEADVWLLTRYRDVHECLRDPRLSADRLRARLVRDNLDRLPPFIRQTATGMRSLLTMDAPDHTRVRKLVNKAFTPRRIAALAGRIQEIVDSQLDGVDAARGMELIHDLAEPVPAIVIAELLGVPAEDHRQFRKWSSELIAQIASQNTAERQQRGAAAAGQLLGYLGDVIAARRREPREDLISAMIHAQEEDDALTDAELLATSNLLLLAGHETTTNLIGNGMLALLREPEQLERLRADPSLMKRAIDELLRFDGPVQATVRATTEDVEIDDRVIPEGALVILNLGAANHDPEVFEDPGRLDLGRDPNPHLAFGFGAHFCMGAPLARLEAEITFRTLLARFPKISLESDTPDYRENPILRGLKHLELSFG